MTEGASIKELVERINASPGWEAFGKGHESSNVQAIPFDPSPVVVVAYYPSCDCGAPALERIETPYEPFLIVASGYMDTCYECGVISSD